MLSFIKKLIPEDFFLRVWWHRLNGFIAAFVYGFPAKKLNIIGVTGTDGKSSTVEFLVSILEEKGFCVGVASTIRFQIGQKKWSNKTHKTTLGRFDLQRLLKRMSKEKCDIVILEASSHALHQGRLIGVPFTSGVITNLSPEHLDFHKTMEKYSHAKELLFKNVFKNKKKMEFETSLIVNIDDYYRDNFLRYKAEKNISYSYKKKKSSADLHLCASNVEPSFKNTKFTLNANDHKIPISLKVLGDFNVYNALAAAAVSINYIGDLNLKNLKIIKKGLESVKQVPGRMEIVDTEDRIAEKHGIKCMIDFGLTEKAMKSLYQTLRRIVTKGKIISVFGSCGNRDTSKRPIIGELAKDLTDVVIICDDETYGEPLDKIRNEILSGIIVKLDEMEETREKNIEKSGLHKYCEKIHEIPNREMAIHYAIKKAQRGDVVIVTGMGDFDSRMLLGGEIPWNEREIIKQGLRKL